MTASRCPCCDCDQECDLGCDFDCVCWHLTGSGKWGLQGLGFAAAKVYAVPHMHRRRQCAVLLQVQQQQQSWHQHYKNVQAASKGEAVSEAEVTWALECVRSRAFSGPYSGAAILLSIGIVVGLSNQNTSKHAKTLRRMCCQTRGETWDASTCVSTRPQLLSRLVLQGELDYAILTLQTLRNGKCCT